MNNSCDKFEGKHFQISFNPISNRYYLKDLDNSLGTFIKITSPVQLINNSLVNIGDSYIVISFSSTDVLSDNMNNPPISVKAKLETIANSFPSSFRKIVGINKKIHLNVFVNNTTQKCKVYLFDPRNNIIIRIGRKDNNSNYNQIELEDPLVSKTNSYIQYNSEEGWYINDGNINDKLDFIQMNNNKSQHIIPSTNGTWILAIDEVEIYDGMIFRGLSNLFLCNIVVNNNKHTEVFH